MKQGPHAGRLWPAEQATFSDPNSGAAVTRLTGHRCHNWHMYFTNSGWWDRHRRLLFNAHRGNQPNLYSLELATGEITQITDLGVETPLPVRRRESGPDTGGFMHPDDERFFFRMQDALWSVHLRSLELTRLLDLPADWKAGSLSVTADSRGVCFALIRKERDCWPDFCDGYRGRICRLDLATGRCETVHEEEAWIGHVNTSPTRPELLSFCHEGAPWRLTSRIWGLNLASGEVWPIHPLTEAEGVNHEWWYPDGEHLGFMASRGEKYRDTCIGRIRYDNTGHVEWPSGPHCTHYYANRTDLVVGDGTAAEPYLFAWSLRDGQWLGPKVVCRHGTSFQCQAVHAHPRLAPDDSYAIFSSDANGYGNVYRVELKPFDELPDWPLADPRWY